MITPSACLDCRQMVDVLCDVCALIEQERKARQIARVARLQTMRADYIRREREKRRRLKKYADALDEHRRKAREAMRALYERRKAQGLTTKGTPRKRPVDPIIELVIQLPFDPPHRRKNNGY